jgi:hypothetical protein
MEWISGLARKVKSVSFSRWLSAVLLVSGILLARKFRCCDVIVVLADNKHCDVQHYITVLSSLFPNVPIEVLHSEQAKKGLEICCRTRRFGFRSVGTIPQPDNRMYRSIPRSVQRGMDMLLFPDAKFDEQLDSILHEASFSCFMHIPTALCCSRGAVVPRLHFAREGLPSRQVAELYLLDVLEAKDDELLSASHVVDDVLVMAYAHHDSFDTFARAVQCAFGLDVTVDSVADCLIANRVSFMSASLTTSGANKLEKVFGAPAHWFTFLQCSSDSISFVNELYDIVMERYGWEYTSFARLINDAFGHDRAEIVRHTPRIFRALNRSRSGNISLDELCAWLARKLSTRTSKHPDQHLLSTLMSLRLPYALFLDKKDLWSRMECSVKSISDDDVHI